MRGFRGFGSDSEGGASEGVGGEGTSPGDSSYGGGSDLGGSYGDNSSTDAANAQALAAALAALNPSAPAVDPMDALMASTGAYGTAPNYGIGSISPDGYSYAQLGMLDDLGYGYLQGINPNNPTQSIGEAMNSRAADSWLTNNIPTLFGIVNPAAGMTLSALQQAQGLISGKTSIGQAAISAASQAVASKLGVPVGVVTGVVNGNPGQTVSSALSGTIGKALTSELSNMTGLPANIISTGLGIAGVPGMVNSGISGTVNSAMGTAPSGQTNMSSLAGAIDSALGRNPGVGATAAPIDTNGFGSFGSGSDGAGGFSLSGSSGAASPFTVQPAVSSAISSGSAGTTSSGSAIPTSNAAIKSMQNLWGPGIDPNFLTSNANQFSDGGSVEDLLKLLRS